MKRILPWVPALFWMTGIFVLSSRPSTQISQTPLLNYLFFKSLHVIEYAILYFFIYRGMRSVSGNLSESSVHIRTYSFTLAYAALDEIHQVFVPTRGGRASDVIIDAIGMALSWTFIHYLLRVLPPKRKRLDRILGIR